MSDDRDAAARLLDDGPEDWLRWWRSTGERELRCILMTAWDPIGVADAPEAWDEYDSYAPSIAWRLRDADDPDVAFERVAEYLLDTERNVMRLDAPRRREACRALAGALVAWHEWSFEHAGRTPRL